MFSAFSDFETKRKWFGSADGDDSKASMDFRVGDREQRISASLATIELPDTGGTRLKLTEQGAYLDGFDEPKVRERVPGA